MGKKKVIVVCHLIIIMLLFSLKSNAQNYKNTTDKVVYNSKTDTIVKVEDKEILIRSDVYGFGLVRESISVYIKFENGDEKWSLFCSLLKITTMLHIEVDQENRILVFKSKNGENLMILPFDVFKLHTNL